MGSMKDQLGDDLFEYRAPPKLPYGGEAPRQKHSATSTAAAQKIKKKIGPLHQKILDYLTSHPGGASDEKMGSDLDMGLNTLRPRRRELQLMDQIVDSERTILTESGRSAVVWVKANG